jgi:low temperature requirement protein LtrA
VARVIAEGELWTLIHLVIVIGIILMPAGLLAVRHSIAENGFTDALTRLGMYAATIGATVGVITVILDGVAAKQLADQWAAAPSSAKAAALGLVSANETVNFALGGLFNLSFAGVPYLLFGLAVARAGIYPRWLGWVAFYAGIGSVLAGLIQALPASRQPSR